jgi:hypothetical protein
MVLALTNIESMIVGTDTIKGILEFTEDVKNAIRSDRTLNYNSKGRSVSSVNGSGTFALTSLAKNIKVSINGKTPTGYDTISCGTSTLSGSDIAANIQASLRALGQYDDDGYLYATCTFDSDTKQFTISSSEYGARSTVAVSAGASNDCSSLLGFDDPTETRGTRLLSMSLKPVTANNAVFPVRYRIIPVTLTEEKYIGGF